MTVNRPTHTTLCGFDVRFWHLAAVVLASALLCTVPSVSSVQAETANVYVEKIPKHWQDQFGGILDEAMLYWEGKIPELEFNTVRYAERSDFVVQWASQFGEGRLGYYSTDTTNVYGKPTLVVTLGFFKDRQWSLVSPEYVLQVTKHELGHALGLPYSDDPNDIMYPTVEDYESWQQNFEEKTLPVIDPTLDLQSSSEEYKKLASDRIIQLEGEVSSAKSLLSSLGYDNKAGKYALDEAWMAFWWAKKHLDNAEKAHIEGGAANLQSNYADSYTHYKISHEYTKKVEQKLAQMEQHVENVNRLTPDGS